MDSNAWLGILKGVCLASVILTAIIVISSWTVGAIDGKHNKKDRDKPGS
jgi:hypothetical protein